MENYKKANEYAVALPYTIIVSIADREGDIYDIYEEANKNFSGEIAKAHYLIRAKTDRKVCDERGINNNEKIKSTLKSERPLGQITIQVSETKKKKSARSAYDSLFKSNVYCIT